MAIDSQASCYQLENRFTLVVFDPTGQKQVVTYPLTTPLPNGKVKDDQLFMPHEAIVDFEVLDKAGTPMRTLDPAIAIRVEYTASQRLPEATSERPPPLGYYNFNSKMWVVLGPREQYNFVADNKGGGYATAVIHEWLDPEFAW